MEYIYLLHELQFIKAGQPIYKLGQTKQTNMARLSTYPKGCRLLLEISYDDSSTALRELSAIFEKHTKPRYDIGPDYFEGLATVMKQLIYKHIDYSHRKMVLEYNKIAIGINDSKKKILEKKKYLDDTKSETQKIEKELAHYDTILKWFCNYYKGHADEIIGMMPQDLGMRIDKIRRIGDYFHNTGEMIADKMANNIFELLFTKDEDFTRIITEKFRELHPENDTYILKMVNHFAIQKK